MSSETDSPAIRTDPVTALVRRHLRDVPGYVFTQDLGALPVAVALRDGEGVAGWYRNPPPHEDEVVVFTTRAMRLWSAGQERTIELDDLRATDVDGTKTTSTGLHVMTTRGRDFIRFAGRHGEHAAKADAFRLLSIVHAFTRAFDGVTWTDDGMPPRLRAVVPSGAAEVRHVVLTIEPGHHPVGRALPNVVTAEIRPDRHGCHLLRLDARGVVLTHTWHPTVEDAKAIALLELGIAEDQWEVDR